MHTSQLERRSIVVNGFKYNFSRARRGVEYFRCCHYRRTERRPNKCRATLVVNNGVISSTNSSLDHQCGSGAIHSIVGSNIVNVEEEVVHFNFVFRLGGIVNDIAQDAKSGRRGCHDASSQESNNDMD